jgi:hypothetical protein
MASCLRPTGENDMRKVVTGVLAILVAGTGGYFGARGWAQQHVEQEVETSLAAMRAGGGNVTRGPVEIDLLRRQVSLSNVVAETAGEPKASMRIGRVVATGIGQPRAGSMSAAQLEIDDLEIDGTIAVGAGLRVTYRIPRLEFADYSGPTVLLYPVDAASPIEAMRAALQQFVAVTASSLAIPTLTVSLAAKESGLSAVEYGYSGIVLRNIGEGRIGSTTVDRVVAAVTGADPNGPTGFTAELEGMQTLDVDLGPILAVLSGSGDDHYRRVYQKITAGSYTVTFDDHRVPVRVLIDGVTAEDVALKPSKLSLADMIPLFSSLPRAGEPVDPQRALALLEAIAGIYDGIRIGSFEVRGIKVALPAPQEPFSIGAIRMAGFENGRLAELSLEGLDTQTPLHEPVKIGRFALQGLGFSELMRSIARLATPAQQPSRNQLVSLLHALEGIEIQGLIIPYRNTGTPVEIETAKISWGEFVGAFPTQVRAALRLSEPITSRDSEPFNQLLAAGMTTATVDLDAGARWNEASRLAVLSPFTTKLANVGSIEVNATFGNVPASAFTLDAATFMAATAAVEAGPIEIVVRDLGGLDLMVSEVARKQNLSPDAARRIVVETATQPAAALVLSSPDLSGLADAVARFIESPGGKLSISITPKGHVPLLPLLVAAQTNPATILAQFRIQPSVTR